MGLFDAPAWDVDRSAKILSEKFGKGRKFQRKGKKRSVILEVPISKPAFYKKPNEKQNNNDKGNILNSLTQFSGDKEPGVVNLGEKSKRKKKNAHQTDQHQFQGKSGKRVGFKTKQLNKTQTTKETKPKGKLINVSLTNIQGESKNNASKVKGKRKRKISAASTLSDSFHKTHRGEFFTKDQKVPSSSRAKNTSSQNRRARKKNLKQNILPFPIETSTKNYQLSNEKLNKPTVVYKSDKKFEGNLGKVLASNAYASHSVKNHKKLKNKTLSAVETTNRSLNETDACTSLTETNAHSSLKETNAKSSPREANAKRPYVARLLNYIAYKNVPLSVEGRNLENFNKRKRDDSEPVNEAQPRKKQKLKNKKTKDVPRNESLLTEQTQHTVLSKDIKPFRSNTATTLRERMMNQLKSSRFRYINEQLYTSSGTDALKIFKNDPEAFEAYHEGYKQQVAQWPLNPISKIINSIKRKSPNLVVADFGCGDAQLAKSLPNKVYSFDLVAICNEVTVCDMAHTPLADSSTDICVFCLSLMGTDLVSYLLEANRVLKVGGLLKIAEVESRFENVEIFIKNLKKYGFKIQNKDLSNNMFYFIDFKKQETVKKAKKLPPLSLKPCYYKRR